MTKKGHQKFLPCKWKFFLKLGREKICWSPQIRRQVSAHGCDNHACSGLMQRIICELSNLSNEIKDTKANQNTKSKKPTTSLQLAIHFSFSLCLSWLIYKLLFIWSTGRNLGRLSFPLLILSVSNFFFFIWSTGRYLGRLSFPLLILSVSKFLGGVQIVFAPNNYGFKKSACMLYG